MTRLSRPPLMASAAAVLCVLAGCSNEIQPDPPPSTAGAECKQGSYWEPRAQECVVPATQMGAYVLTMYRYVDGLAKQDPDTEFEYSISLKPALSEASFVVLLGTLEPIRFVNVRVLVSDVRSGVSFQPPVPPETALSDVIDAAFRSTFTPGATASREADALQSELQTARREGRFAVSVVTVRSTAAGMRAWWLDHWSEVRVVQPQVTDVDRAQITLGSGGPD